MFMLIIGSTNIYVSVALPMGRMRDIAKSGGGFGVATGYLGIEFYSFLPRRIYIYDEHVVKNQWNLFLNILNVYLKKDFIFYKKLIVSPRLGGTGFALFYDFYPYIGILGYGALKLGFKYKYIGISTKYNINYLISKNFKIDHDTYIELGLDVYF